MPPPVDELRITVPGTRLWGGICLRLEFYNNGAAAPLGNGSTDINRGIVLGGSSALNYLCYLRVGITEHRKIRRSLA